MTQAEKLFEEFGALVANLSSQQSYKESIYNKPTAFRIQDQDLKMKD